MTCRNLQCCSKSSLAPSRSFTYANSFVFRKPFVFVVSKQRRTLRSSTCGMFSNETDTCWECSFQRNKFLGTDCKNTKDLLQACLSKDFYLGVIKGRILMWAGNEKIGKSSPNFLPARGSTRPL